MEEDYRQRMEDSLHHIHHLQNVRVQLEEERYALCASRGGLGRDFFRGGYSENLMSVCSYLTAELEEVKGIISGKSAKLLVTTHMCSL